MRLRLRVGTAQYVVAVERGFKTLRRPHFLKIDCRRAGLAYSLRRSPERVVEASWSNLTTPTNQAGKSTMLKNVSRNRKPWCDAASCKARPGRQRRISFAAWSKRYCA